MVLYYLLVVRVILAVMMDMAAGEAFNQNSSTAKNAKRDSIFLTCDQLRSQGRKSIKGAFDAFFECFS